MVKLTKIYTRGGDAGETSLVDGKRRRKDDARIEAYGTVDEVNAAIGVVRLHTSGLYDDMLARIQNDLFDLGADLATPGEDFIPNPDDEMPALRIMAEQTKRLEEEIDAMNENLSPLTSFILPGGSEAAAHLHMARTIARRAERLIIKAQDHEAINPEAVKYINRLSDHLFVMSRATNQNGTADVLWVPGANR